MPSSTPLYLDWQFWSAIAALFAIVLSQLPPIRLWFKAKNLDAEIHGNIQVTHKIGNPNLGAYLTLYNSGGRAIHVRSISMSIYRDRSLIGEYPANMYFETPSSSIPLFFVPFKLEPGEGWAHSITLLNQFERAIDKRVRDCESALRTDIRMKLERRPDDDKNPVVAENHLLEPFYTLFNQLFIWLPGEYKAVLNVKTEVANEVFSKKYKFTLFESESAELRSHVEDYRFGGGLSYKVDRHAGIFVPLAPTND
ncbi:MAG: hypothetical protein Q7L07_14730 [Pseudohongiella sp.]|nr:hypothetical protein [Pseudohongiella sp.]MDP2286331.1 hypothetical protein [Pseudohongiella sp.]